MNLKIIFYNFIYFLFYFYFIKKNFLIKHYEKLGHKTFGLFLSDEQIQIKNTDKNVSIVNTFKQIHPKVIQSGKYYGKLKLELDNIMPVQKIMKY